jgi:hypothetical protein
MSTEPEALPMRERSFGIVQGACTDASAEVAHIYEPDGAETMDCGHGSHDPGMVELSLDHDGEHASIWLTPAGALLLANRLIRAANVILESGEELPDVEREAARFSGTPIPAAPPRVLTEAQQKVWDAWNALPGDHESPVKQIARDLGMTPADVGAIVYPDAETFGVWDDKDEPDLPD